MMNNDRFETIQKKVLSGENLAYLEYDFDSTVLIINWKKEEISRYRKTELFVCNISCF